MSDRLERDFWQIAIEALTGLERWFDADDGHDPEAVTDPDTGPSYCPGCDVAEQATELKAAIGEYLQFLEGADDVE